MKRNPFTGPYPQRDPLLGLQADTVAARNDQVFLVVVILWGVQI